MIFKVIFVTIYMIVLNVSNCAPDAGAGDWDRDGGHRETGQQHDQKTREPHPTDPDRSDNHHDVDDNSEDSGRQYRSTRGGLMMMKNFSFKSLVNNSEL